jgi:membrane fusion protein, multidrug efflux system
MFHGAAKLLGEKINMPELRTHKIGLFRNTVSLMFGLSLLASGGALLRNVIFSPPEAQAGTVDETPTVLPVSTFTVRLLDGYEVQESYAGRVISRRNSSLGFERGGSLTEVMVDEGDHVKEGDVLAVLDTRRLQAQLTELQAELERSRANAEETKARHAFASVTVQRNKKLLTKQQISAQADDEAVFEEKSIAAQLAAANATIRKVEATIKALKVDIDLSILRAPFSGSIVARLADEGTVVDPGTPVLRLIEDGKLEAHVGIPSRAVDNLKLNQIYTIDVGGKHYPAKLRTVLAEIDPQTRTVTAVFDLTQSEPALRGGQLARLEMTQSISSPGFWLPITALTESRRGLWGAYALDPSPQGNGLMRLDRRELQLLHSEADRAFVRGTLLDGEVVVASGLHRLVPNQLVRIVGEVK